MLELGEQIAGQILNAMHHSYGYVDILEKAELCLLADRSGQAVRQIATALSLT